jgi:hypothetical protein
MDKPKFRSENLEPIMAHVMGVMWARVCWEEQWGDSVTVARECEAMWYAAQAIEKLAVVTGCGRGAVHFSIASSNNIRHCADLIEKVTGYRPEEIV